MLRNPEIRLNLSDEAPAPPRDPCEAPPTPPKVPLHLGRFPSVGKTIQGGAPVRCCVQLVYTVMALYQL